MKKVLFTMALAITVFSASAQKTSNLDTLCVTTTPQMHCEGCEKKIKSNLRFVKGIKKIVTSVPQQKVTIVYDKTKSSPTIIAEAFRKIGYEVKKCQKS